MDLSCIIGVVFFLKGLDGFIVMFGLYVKVVVYFDWGVFDELVKVIEVGIMVDVFFKDVLIMVESLMVFYFENSLVFINFYLNL